MTIILIRIRCVAMLRNAVIYIYEVYREKSFSKAAQKLYVSQPALSAAIQREEARWGCAFFDRSRTPVEPTESGRRFIAAIEHMMKEQHELEEYFEKNSPEQHRTINIGAPAFFCIHVLPALINSFGKEHRNARINIIEADADDLVNSLQAETVDICIAVEKWPHTAYKSIEVSKEEIVLVVPQSFPVNRRLAGKSLCSEHLSGLCVAANAPKVSISEFADVPFLLLKKGNDMHERAQEIFRRARVTPKVIMTLDQLMTSYHMAAAGIGAAFVRAELMRYDASGLCFYRLDDSHTTRGINLVYKKSRKLPAVAEEFIEFMTKHFVSGASV